MTSHRAGAGLVTSSLGASAALFCRSSASKPQSDTAFSSSLTVAALASKTTCAAVQDALTSVSRQSATAASSCLPCCQAARRSASPLRKAHRKTYLEKQTRAGRRSQDHAQSSLFAMLVAAAAASSQVLPVEHIPASTASRVLVTQAHCSPQLLCLGPRQLLDTIAQRTPRRCWSAAPRWRAARPAARPARSPPPTSTRSSACP